MKKAFTLIELLIVVAIIAILAAIAVPNFLEAQTRAKISRVKADLRTYVVGIQAYKVDYNKFPKWKSPIDPFIGTTGGNPRAGDWWWTSAVCLGMIPLTTPTAYLTSVSQTDPFLSRLRAGGGEVPQNVATHQLFNFFFMAGEIGKSYSYVDYTFSAPAGITPLPFLTYGDTNINKGNNPLKRRSDTLTLYSGGPAGNPAGCYNMMYYWMDYKLFGTVQSQQWVADGLYDPTNGTVSKGALVRIVGESQGFPETPN